MRNRSDILNKTNTKTGCLKSTESGLTTGARALYINFDSTHSMFLRLLGTIFSSYLSRKRSAFT